MTTRSSPFGRPVALRHSTTRPARFDRMTPHRVVSALFSVALASACVGFFASTLQGCGDRTNTELPQCEFLKGDLELELPEDGIAVGEEVIVGIRGSAPAGGWNGGDATGLDCYAYLPLTIKKGPDGGTIEAAAEGSLIAEATLNPQSPFEDEYRFEFTKAGLYTMLITPSAGEPIEFDLTVTPDGTGTVATTLVFLDSPQRAKPNVAFGVQPRVQVVDGFGDPVIDFDGIISVRIREATGEPGANLLPAPARVRASGGIAEFRGLRIDKAGFDYQLEATAEGLVPVFSEKFDVVDSQPVKLRFLVQPSSVPAGNAINPPVKVELLDADDERVPLVNVPISVRIADDAECIPGPCGNLTGVKDNIGTDATGVTTFPELYINIPAAGYRLVAESAGLLPAESVEFFIGEVETLEVVDGDKQVGDPGTTLPKPLAVKAVGSNKAPVPGIDLIFESGDGGTLIPVVVKTDAEGIARTSWTLGFSEGTQTATVRVSKGGALPATFTATAVEGGVLPDDDDDDSSDDDDDDATGGATKLFFVRQPSDGVAGKKLATQPQVEVRDENDQKVTTFTGTVALTLKSGTGGIGATLIGSATVGIINGTATFANVGVDREGTNYVLTALSSGLIAADSQPFSVAEATGNVLSAVSGGGQIGTRGTKLASPIVVQVLNEEGKPVAGVSVQFTVTRGGGAVDSPSVVTDNDGRAQTMVTLGTTPGLQTVAASSNSVVNDAIEFSFTAQ